MIFYKKNNFRTFFIQLTVFFNKYFFFMQNFLRYEKDILNQYKRTLIVRLSPRLDKIQKFFT